MGDDRFAHGTNGTSLIRDRTEQFPWQLVSSTGELLRSYLLLDCCLDNGPLEIGADIWGALEHYPLERALVLQDHGGEPTEFTGKWMLDNRDNGSLKLYPATYRLVHQPSNI